MTAKIKECTWKDIPGYNGLYMVNNYGEILRCRRVQGRNPLTGGDSVYPSVVMRARKNKCGYMQIILVDNDGVRQTWLVHRAVAAAFLEGGDDSKMQVNHIDGDKTNNCLSNLELVTAKENTRHAILTGLRPKKIDEEKMGDIISRYLKGESQRSIARIYGVHYGTIYEYIRKYKKGEIEWLVG